MNWQPIETAPKDGTKIMVYCPKFGVSAPAHWVTQQFHKKPKPYWSHFGEYLMGIQAIRDDQPTHWKPLPDPPA